MESLFHSLEIIRMHAAAMFNLPFGFVTHFISSQLRALPLAESGTFAGQHVIITGANVGLGLEAARHVARLGAARVVLACRSVEKGEAARRDILASLQEQGQGRGLRAAASPSSSKNGGGGNDGSSDNNNNSSNNNNNNNMVAGGSGSGGSACQVEAWPLDLTSFESVREFCGRAERELGGRLDVLIENAGLATGGFEEAEGFEKTITTNVLSTFLLALMLLPLMRKTAAKYNTTPRLCIVSSSGHLFAGFRERSNERIFDHYRGGERMQDRYNTSKLLEVLIVQELAARVSAVASPSQPQQPQSQSTAIATASDHGKTSNNRKDSNHAPVVIVNVLNPGLCRTQLFRHVPFPISLVVRLGVLLLGREAEAGARTLVAAACAGPASHGRYMDSCVAAAPSAFVCGDEGARAQEKVWAELAELLERAEPGVMERAGLGTA